MALRATSPPPGPGSADELDAGDFDSLLTVLGTYQTSCEEARKAVTYFERNRHRMRYARFRAQGLCIATGVVEAGCKIVVAQRLKRAGMHWSLDGANAILALRCAKLSGRFEMFCKPPQDNRLSA